MQAGLLNQLESKLSQLKCAHGHEGLVKYVKPTHKTTQRFLCTDCYYNMPPEKTNQIIDLASYCRNLKDKANKTDRLSGPELAEVETGLMTIKRLKLEVSEGVSQVRERISAQYDDFIAKMIKAAERLKDGTLAKIDKATSKHLGELETMDSILASFAENGLDQPKDEIVDQIKNYIDKKPVADDSLYDLLSSLDASKTLRLTNMRLNHFTSKFAVRKQETTDFLKQSVENQFDADTQLCQSFINGQQAILRSLKSNVVLEVPHVRQTVPELSLGTQATPQATYPAALPAQVPAPLHIKEQSQITELNTLPASMACPIQPAEETAAHLMTRPKTQTLEQPAQAEKPRHRRERDEPRIGKRDPRDETSFDRDRVSAHAANNQLKLRSFGGDKSNIRSLFTNPKNDTTYQGSTAAIEFSPALKKHGQPSNQQGSIQNDHQDTSQDALIGERAGREILPQTPKRLKPAATGRRGPGFYRHTGYRDTELKKVLDSDYKTGHGIKKSQYQELSQALAIRGAPLGDCPATKPSTITPLSALPAANPGKKYAANDPRRLYQELKENIQWLKSTRSPNAARP